MNIERELTIDELDAVSGGAASSCPGTFFGGCPIIWPDSSPTEVVLIHERPHA